MHLVSRNVGDYTPCTYELPVHLLKKEGVQKKPIIGLLLLCFCLNQAQQEGDNIISKRTTAI